MLNDQCQKWRDSTNAEMVKGFHFLEKKLNHLENRVVMEKLTSAIEKTFESKFKSYANNLMMTTIESLLNKQLQTVSQHFNKRIDTLEEQIIQQSKSELKPGITSNQSPQKSSNFEMNEQVRRTATDTQIKLKEIEDSIKQLENKVQGGIAKNDVNRKMIVALDTKLTNNSKAMHTLHERTLTDVTEQLKRIESEQTGVVEMNLSAVKKTEDCAKMTRTKVERMEDRLKLITDKIDQNTTKLKAIEKYSSATGPTAQMVEQLGQKVERNKNVSQEKLDVLHTTLHDIHRETESCSNSVGDVSKYITIMSDISKENEGFRDKGSDFSLVKYKLV